MNVYHQKSIDILDRDVYVSDIHIRLLEELSMVYMVNLPDSFTEWYSLKDSIDILSKYSNSDAPLNLMEMIEAGNNQSGYLYWNFHGMRLIPIMVENQSSCLWCIHLDETEDPPVGYWDENDHWVECATSFSEFISERIWMYMCNNGNYYTFEEAFDFADEVTLYELVRLYHWDKAKVTSTGILHFSTSQVHITLQRMGGTYRVIFCAENMEALSAVSGFMARILPINLPEWLS